MAYRERCKPTTNVGVLCDMQRAVADPGFDMGEGVRGLCQGGMGGRKTLKVLKVGLKVIFIVF